MSRELQAIFEACALIFFFPSFSSFSALASENLFAEELQVNVMRPPHDCGFAIGHERNIRPTDSLASLVMPQITSYHTSPRQIGLALM